MKATIISVGDELLIGQVVNTNAAFIAEKLNAAGIEVENIVTIGDNWDQIRSTLKSFLNESRIVIMTGGLGPTSDDITKQVLCEYFESKLVFHEETFQNIQRIFKRYGREVTEKNRMQAEVPENCTILPNSMGTAPGMWFKRKGINCISIPGVPFEMEKMMEEQVIPQLSERYSLDPLVHYTIQTQGVGESHLSEMIADWEIKLPSHIGLGYLPQPGIVRLRLTGSGKKADVKQEIESQAEELKKIIGDYIWGYEKDTLEGVVGKALKDINKTLSTAESCTGGYIAHLITRIAGSSEYYKGSVVAYANEIKQNILGVNPLSIINYGAVSEQVVTEMALGVKEKFNTDFAVAVSGIAGPEGGTPEKPVGTVWIAIASPGKVSTFKYNFGNDRIRNIRLTAITALNLLRKTIIS